MLGWIRELYDYRSMVWNLVRRDLRGRYKGSLLGFLWNFILPLMQILVYIMVFTVVFRQNIEHYYVYIIVGMVPWTMFNDAVLSSSGSIIENSQLVSKIYFPRTVIPLSMVISKFINFLISMGIALLILAVGGHGFDGWALASLPVAVFCLFVFSLGLSLLLAAADVYMRDVQYMVNVILMMLIWLTPIMYVKDFIDNDTFQTMLDINPLTYIVEMFQDCLYWKAVPGIEDAIIAVAASVIMLLIGTAVFEKYSPDFAEVL